MDRQKSNELQDKLDQSLSHALIATSSSKFN